MPKQKFEIVSVFKDGEARLPGWEFLKRARSLTEGRANDSRYEHFVAHPDVLCEQSGGALQIIVFADALEDINRKTWVKTIVTVGGRTTKSIHRVGGREWGYFTPSSKVLVPLAA